MSMLMITEHKDRISPVFDCATILRVVNLFKDCDPEWSRHRLDSTGPSQRAKELLSFGHGIVLCGAISRPYKEALIYQDIEVIGFLAGDVEEIISAFQKQTFKISDFSMPGCGGFWEKRRCRRRRCWRDGRKFSCKK